VADNINSGEQMPVVPAMPKPPDARIIPLDRQEPLTHAQVEQVRFGLGDTGPLAQAVMNANVPAVMKQLTIGAVSCLSSRKPADPVIGQMVFETDTFQVKFWNGSAWVTPANASPTGSLTQFAGSAAPSGWLLCDGASKLVSDYPALYAVIGVTYGGVLGTSFNLPDMRGRAPIGLDTQVSGSYADRVTSTGSGITATTLGATGGNQLIPAHSHSFSDSYTYTKTDYINNGNQLASGAFYGRLSFSQTATSISGTGTVGAVNAPTSQFVSGTSSGSANMPPAIVLNYIIKT